MCGNLFVIAKENGKIVFRRGAYAAVMFLFLVPFLYGTAGLDREKAADCLGRLVALVGIPLFVFLLKPEQEPGVRDIMLIREFPYRVMICLRMVFAAFLSVILICFFVLYMQYQGCDVPVAVYTVRTVEVSMFIGGVGLLGSALIRRTLAGVLMSVGFVFLFYDHLAEMVLAGVPGVVMVIGMLLYGGTFLLCAGY